MSNVNGDPHLVAGASHCNLCAADTFRPSDDCLQLALREATRLHEQEEHEMPAIEQRYAVFERSVYWNSHRQLCLASRLPTPMREIQIALH